MGILVTGNLYDDQFLDLLPFSLIAYAHEKRCMNLSLLRTHFKY